MIENTRILSREEAVQDVLQGDAGVLPLQTEQEAENMFLEKLPLSIAILPLRNTVMFPGIVMPITVGRKKSMVLIEKAYKNNKSSRGLRICLW